jgi:hypothetical protein
MIFTKMHEEKFAHFLGEEKHKKHDAWSSRIDSGMEAVMRRKRKSISQNSVTNPKNVIYF